VFLPQGFFLVVHHLALYRFVFLDHIANFYVDSIWLRKFPREWDQLKGLTWQQSVDIVADFLSDHPPCTQLPISFQHFITICHRFLMPFSKDVRQLPYTVRPRPLGPTIMRKGMSEKKQHEV